MLKYPVHSALKTSVVWWVLVSLVLSARAATNSVDETAARLIGVEERFKIPTEGAVAEPLGGIVNYTPGRRLQESRVEKRTKLEHDDKLATAQSSHVLILTPQQAAALGPQGLIRIQRLAGTVAEAIKVEQGKLYFKSIGIPQPGEPIRVLLDSGELELAGTEFYIDAATNRPTVVLMLDGSAKLSGQEASNKRLGELQPGYRGRLAAGSAPEIEKVGPVTKQLFNETVQWFLYYPAVLHLEDLSEDFGKQPLFQESMAAYRAGDVQRAWETLPADAAWDTAEKKLYAAALLLAIGDLERTEPLLAQLQAVVLPASERDRVQRLANALRELIAAVKFDDAFKSTFEPRLSTEWLARSFYLQSGVHDPRNIEEALQAALRSVPDSPHATNFAYGWVQVAALQFSRGHTPAAQEAVAKAIQLAPSHAAAYALQGFLFAAGDRRKDAEQAFEKALNLNRKLGDAWLGLGLMAFHQNDASTGLQRLQIAVAQEPQRSVLRSYLGKGYYEAATSAANPLDSLKQLFIRGTNRTALIARATNELRLARMLDPKDPTPDLYSALIKQQQNRVNEAVSDLENSKELNRNRHLYRSALLLDQDQAVRSANLAAIYRDAGMTEWSVREASRALASEYANHSAHLFLANSYDGLRDPSLVNLRYETPAFSEYFLANLLAPVGAGSLSPYLSQQEYSNLFEGDGMGFSSASQYLSRGDWQQVVSHYGTYGKSSYSVTGSYRSEAGQRPNNDLEDFTGFAQIKQQLSPDDLVYLETIYDHRKGGDLAQHYDPSQANTTLRFTERQEPNLFAGYNHTWRPGVHTLFLAGWLNDDFTQTAVSGGIQTLIKDDQGTTTGVLSPPSPFALDYASKFNAYSVEVQQIWQPPEQADPHSKHVVIVGTRFQAGETETSDLAEPIPFVSAPFFDQPASFKQNTTDLQRVAVYGYYNWQIVEPLLLTAGISYDHLRYPCNIDSTPISDQACERDQFSPKAGFLWTPNAATTFRGAYTRSLGGLFYDQSIRLEPTQIAGFNQAYRSLIPESVIGPVPGARFESFGIGAGRRFKSRTYVDLAAEILQSDAERVVGVFDYNPNDASAIPSDTRQSLDYREKSLTFTLNQLVGDEWSFGLRYKLTRADLDSRLVEIPESVPYAERQADNRATLHQLNGFAIYNHPGGFFGELESVWTFQRNAGYAPSLPGENFWQFNGFAGYRFSRRAEITLGLLNFTSQDYRLNPLTLHAELPHKRTLMASLRFNF